jgi:hypothetical protein
MKTQDQIIREALKAVQARERSDPMRNPQEGLNRAMGSPSDRVIGSVGDWILEAVDTVSPKERPSKSKLTPTVNASSTENGLAMSRLWRCHRP